MQLLLIIIYFIILLSEIIMDFKEGDPFSIIHTIIIDLQLLRQIANRGTAQGRHITNDRCASLPFASQQFVHIFQPYSKTWLFSKMKMDLSYVTKSACLRSCRWDVELMREESVWECPVKT